MLHGLQGQRPQSLAISVNEISFLTAFVCLVALMLDSRCKFYRRKMRRNLSSPIKRGRCLITKVYFFVLWHRIKKIDCNGGQTKQSVMSNISNALTLKDTSFERLIMALLGSMKPIFSVFNWNPRITITFFILSLGLVRVFTGRVQNVH